MNHYNYIFHADVTNDSDDAVLWYESQRKGLGDKFLLSVKNKIADIVASPESYSVRSKQLYREAKLNVFPYLIVYKILKKHKLIFIVSIHHEKKSPAKKYRK